MTENMKHSEAVKNSGNARFTTLMLGKLLHVNEIPNA